MGGTVSRIVKVRGIENAATWESVVRHPAELRAL